MNTYFSSDPHFGHRNIVKFTRDDGWPLRDFSSVEEHDEYIIQKHNEIVKPNDKWYCLGDVVINKKCLKILERLNGRKTLIAGNHDIFNSKEYLKYFDNVRAYKHYPKHRVVFSHIPVHESQLEYRFKWNVHGHLHANIVTKKNWLLKKVPDCRYLNICYEHLDGYYPLSFDQILERLK